MYIKSNRRSLIIQILKREISLTDLAEHQLVKNNGMYNSFQLNKDWCKWHSKVPPDVPIHNLTCTHERSRQKA